MVDFPSLLPAECTLDILSLLEPHNLTAAIRVSSVWRWLAKPLLYRHVVIWSVAAMDALGRTITEVPDLGNLVQRVCVYMLEAKRGVADLERVVIARVLVRLPRLRTLHFHRWVPDPDFLDNAVKEAGIGDFQELTELAWGDESSLSLLPPDERLMHLWRLPAIRSLRVSLNEARVPLPEVWPMANTLQRLNLGFSFIAERAVGRLLQASPALRSLRYHRFFEEGES
jgi:F-box-like